ncbi:MAG: TolC family outer membrane protein [Gammaproteobacteria bacterium]
MKRFLVSATLAAMAVLITPVAQSDDLWEVYQLALDNDPQIREAAANRRVAVENKPQAIANLLPQLDLSATEQTQQDRTGSQSFFDSGSLQNVSLPLDQQTENTSITLTLRQSVFNWGSWAQIRQANSQVAQAEADYQNAQQDLIIRVSQAYFDLLGARDRLEQGRATTVSVGRQLEQTKKRFEVGLIAITDVQESQSAYDTAVAAVIAAERNLATAREGLRSIVGVYIDPYTLRTDLPLIPPDPQDDEQWVSTAMSQNLSLISARLGMDIATEGSARSRSAHYPTLDLVLSRNKFDQQQESIIAGVLSPSEVDVDTNTVRLQLQVPIFNGGRIRSQVRQAVAREDAAKEIFNRTVRNTEFQTRDFYLGVISEMSRVGALRQAMLSSETALRATEAGFEVGTRTTVDVLDARRRVFEARTAYLQSRYDYVMNTLRLKTAAGLLQATDVRDVSRWMEPYAGVNDN